MKKACEPCPVVVLPVAAIANPEDLKLTPAEILECTATYFGLSVASLRSRRQKRRYTDPRHAYCYVANRLTAASLKAIGEAVNRDHSTVIGSRRSIRNYFKSADPFAAQVEAFETFVRVIARRAA